MKRQVIVSGKESDWFEKAIFVMKERSHHPIPANLAEYADNLVEMYLKKNPVPYISDDSKKRGEIVQKYSEEMKRGEEIKRKNRAKRRWYNLILDCILFLCFIGVGIVLYEMTL